MNYEYRRMHDGDLVRLRELDRSEHVTTAFAMDGDELISRSVEWDIPRWLDGDGHDSYGEKIDFCREHMAAGARILGCFTAGDQLVGIGVVRSELEPGVAQLAFLHVSRSHRREGLAAELLAQLIEWARTRGARELYVSAAPTGSAVPFYRSAGFRVTDHPNAELLALEPEDIHLRRPI